MVELSKAELEYFKTFSLDITQETMPWLCQCELRQTTIGLIVNKFGDQSKKIQCHAINTLVKVVSQAKRDMDNETHRIILSEVLLFL